MFCNFCYNRGWCDKKVCIGYVDSALMEWIKEKERLI